MFDLLKSALAAAVILGAACGGAPAQEKNACDQFKWSVARERAWFAAAPTPAASGATILAGQGYVLALQPSASVAFRLPPERAPKPGSFGATLSVAAIDKPGLYEITLSDEAWLDVIQGDAPLKSVNFSGQKDCPGVRKSVRFNLAAGALTIQVSNAGSAAIDLALAPAQP
jgi:hypothetical protein